RLEFPDPKVQLRAAPPARPPRGPQPLTGGDSLAGGDTPAGQVGVERDPAAAERDLHEVPVALLAARRADSHHSPRLCCAHGRGAEDPDVDPRMPAAAVVAER